MNRNSGHLANSADLHPNKGHFGAANSVVTIGEQFVPPYAGSLTSVSVTTWGILWSSSQTVIENYRVQFTGDAANVAGQTATPKLYYLRAGVATLIPGSTGDPIATTAGQKNGAKDLVAVGTPFTPAPGDVILFSLTMSAALTAALTGVMCSLG